MPITALPTPPARSMSSDAFVAAADAFLGALPTFQAEANALEANVNGKEVTTTASATSAAISASSASNSAIQASTSASQAALYGTAVLWVSGTTYAVGNVVVAPANKLLYKRKVAGAGTTDPSLDATNWESVGLSGGASHIKLSAILATLPALTLVDHCFHLERDDTPRARGWRRRKGQSWRSEARSVGTHWGSYATATLAVAAGAITGDVYYNTTSSAFHEVTGATTSTVTYRAGREDYPTNALITVEVARVIIWDLDGAVPSMWMVFTFPSGGNGVIGWATSVALTSVSVAAFNNVVVVGTNEAGTVCNFVGDKFGFFAAAAIGSASSTTISTRNGATDVLGKIGYAIVNSAVNDVAITVLPDAPIDENGMPVPTIAVATAGGVSVIKHDGTVVNDTTTTGTSVVSTHVGFTKNSRLMRDWNNSLRLGIYNLTNGIPAASFANMTYYDLYATVAAGGVAPILPEGNGYVGVVSQKGVVSYGGSGFSILVQNEADRSKSMFCTLTSTYNTGWMTGDIRRCFLSNSKTADRSVKAATLTEVGTVTETTYAGGRSVYSGFSAANYFQEASHADWNALGTGDFNIIMSGVKWGTAATLKTILSIGDGASNGSVKIEHLAANTLRLSIYNAGWTTICTSTAAFTDTAEHVLSVKRSGTTCSIVVDGVVVASGTSALTISNATGYLRIGEGQDASQPFAGGQCSCVRISATASTAEQSKFIAATENALNSGHACLLSNSSTVSQLDYYSRSDMLAVGNGTNTDFFNNLAREGVITTSTGATVSGTLPSEATFFHTGTTNTVRVGERNVEAELTEQIPAIPKTLYYSFTSSGTTQAIPQGWKARGVAFNLTDGTMLAVAQTFDGFIYTQTGLTNAKAYQVELEEVL